MANSVHTKMQGLIDLISRPSKPSNGPAQQGDAFRKSMMDPNGPAAGAAKAEAASARGETASARTASSDLNWVEGDEAARQDAALEDAMDLLPETADADGSAEQPGQARDIDPAETATAGPNDIAPEAGDRDEADTPEETAAAALAAPVATGAADKASTDRPADATTQPEQPLRSEARSAQAGESPAAASQQTASAEQAAEGDIAGMGHSGPATADTGTAASSSQDEQRAAGTRIAVDNAAPAHESEVKPAASATAPRHDNQSAAMHSASNPAHDGAGIAAAPAAAAAVQTGSAARTPQDRVQAAAGVQRAAPHAARGSEPGKEATVRAAASERPADLPEGIMSSAAMTPPEETASQQALSDATGKTESVFSIAQPAAGAPGPAINVTNGIVLQGMQPNAAMIATPPEVVDIVRAQLAGTDGSERITVQLDPPELGRVSIDFKFDAQQGLQHITVTGDSPEAMRQLRQLHFQLAQALEQHGLSSQDMTFRQNTSQQGQQSPGRFSGGPLSFAEDELATHTLTAAGLASRSRTIAAGLDIKL